MRRLFAVLVFGLAIAMARVASAQAHAQPPEAQLKVAVSIPPLVSLLQLLVPPGSKVESLIPPGVSEHGYEIPPTRLATIANADLIVYVGLGIEPQVEKQLSEHPRAGRMEVCFAKVVGIDTQPREHHHDDGDAGHEDGHHDEVVGADPHLWLDPQLVKKLGDAVSKQMVAHGTDYESQKTRLAVFNGRVDAMDMRYQRTLAGAKRRALIVGHDAWQRLGDRYRIETIAIAGLQASEPTPKAMSNAARAAKEKGVTAVGVEPQLSRTVADRIAKGSNLEVLPLDPLGSGDWFAMMESNLATLAKALGAALPAPETPAPAPTPK
jgi:zinc transport system substrate-binding protein